MGFMLSGRIPADLMKSQGLWIQKRVAIEEHFRRVTKNIYALVKCTWQELHW